MMLSFQGICLACSTFTTLQWFCCTYWNFSDNSPQG